MVRRHLADSGAPKAAGFVDQSMALFGQESGR